MTVSTVKLFRFSTLIALKLKFSILTFFAVVWLPKSTIPILSNVVLQAASEKLSLTATDMDMDIITTTPCSISSEGATTIPAHL